MFLDIFVKKMLPSKILPPKKSR